MKQVIILSFCTVLTLSLSGQEFNKLINQSADTIAKKVIATNKKKVAITDFVNIDQSITQLGTFLSEELSSELSNLTENQIKFRVLERSNLNQIVKEKRLLNLHDGSAMAKELGKVDAADILIFGTITDFDGYYRVVIKLLDTKTGDALSSYKVNFVRTPSLETLNKQTIKKNENTSISNTENTGEVVKATGDFCFKNTSGNFDRPSVKISVRKIGNDESLKIINVGNGETDCVYDLAPGVYKVDLSWTNIGVNLKNESKEIRVTGGKSGLLILKY